eukprot:4408456-Prymnesium_polylepis.1
MRHRTCGQHRGCDTGRAADTEDATKDVTQRMRHRTCGRHRGCDTGREGATQDGCGPRAQYANRTGECWSVGVLASVGG